MDRMEWSQIDTDIYDLLNEVGDSTRIKYKKLIVSGDNFYDEKPEKTYSPDIIITALVKFNPKEEEISAIGRDQGCEIIFTVSAKELTVKKLLFRDTSRMSLDDAIEYNGEVFNIVNIIPSAIIIGLPLLYKIEVKRDE